MPNREAAEARCRESGITDRTLLNDCIIDYGETSDFLFANSYSRSQQILAARAVIPHRAEGLLRTVMMRGAVSDAAPRPEQRFSAQAGDIVWLGNPDCVDNYMQAAFKAPDDKFVPGTGGAICAAGRLVLPATGEGPDSDAREESSRTISHPDPVRPSRSHGVDYVWERRRRRHRDARRARHLHVRRACRRCPAVFG